MVPTNPTVCVAYSSLVVSAVTALSVATPPSGTSHVSGGQQTHTPKVIHPAQSAPPSSSPIPPGGNKVRLVKTQRYKGNRIIMIMLLVSFFIFLVPCHPTPLLRFQCRYPSLGDLLHIMVPR